MRREEKNAIIDSLAERLKEYGHFYLTDTAQLNAADTSDLRRKCFENDIKLKGTTSIMFTQSGNVPAKLIKEFRKKHDKPVLKGAYVQESIYVGENQLEALISVKSKKELIGDVVLLLQSPAKNVIGALQSGGTKIHGVLETLSKREEK